MRAGSVVAWSPWEPAGRELSGMPVMVSGGGEKSSERRGSFQRVQSLNPGKSTLSLVACAPLPPYTPTVMKTPLAPVSIRDLSHFAAI